jgi:hypothetical protein
MKFDLDYAKKVIAGEAEAIKGLVRIVDNNFARAAEI